MSPSNRWPDLSWVISSEPLPWLLERTQALGRSARAFELALEASAEASEASLSRVASELEHWEHLTANVWMYAGLGGAGRLQADEVPVHAGELAKVYGSLLEARQAILDKLGAKESAAVIAREAVIEVDEKSILDRAGELPSFDAGGGLPGASSMLPGAEADQPVTPDEMRRRTEAEQKPLPPGADLRACLAILPPPWLAAIFDTLGLAMPLEDDDDEAEITANSRSAIQRRVIPEGLSDALLREVIYALEPEDRAVLGELLGAGGALRYSEVRGKAGADDSDGFQWLQRPPSGTLARLRRTGLAYVGMREGKQVLAVPADLASRIAALLQPAG